MSNPKGHVKFDRYRDQIKMRSDRIDPYWSMTMDYDQVNYNPETLKTMDLDKVSPRKINEVYSKYPIRATMNLRVPQNN